MGTDDTNALIKQLRESRRNLYRMQLICSKLVEALQQIRSTSGDPVRIAEKALADKVEVSDWKELGL